MIPDTKSKQKSERKKKINKTPCNYVIPELAFFKKSKPSESDLGRVVPLFLYAYSPFRERKICLMRLMSRRFQVNSEEDINCRKVLQKNRLVLIVRVKLNFKREVCKQRESEAMKKKSV